MEPLLSQIKRRFANEQNQCGLSPTPDSSGGAHPQLRCGRRVRGQGGVTLIEVVLVVALISLVTSVVAAWSMATVVANTRTKQMNKETATISLLNTVVLRDVAAAQFGVSKMMTDGTSRGDAPSPTAIVDCPAPASGPNTGAGEPVLALVTPADRRIVYTLVDAAPGSTDRGKVLYRRDCANLKTIAGAGTQDETLTDPIDDYLNNPSGEALNTTTQIRKITDGLASIETSCPYGDVTDLGPSDPADPNSPHDFERKQDPACQTIRFQIQSARPSSKPIVFQGTRRTDIYCPPGCPPVAWFTWEPSPAKRGEPVTFDATKSLDRRSIYWGAADDPDNRLHYHWDFDDPQLISDSPETFAKCDAGTTSTNNATKYPTPGTGIDPRPTSDSSNPTHTYNKLTSSGNNCGGRPFQVTLTVTNKAGVQSKITRQVRVTGTSPHALIGDPAPGSIKHIIRNTSVQFTGEVRTYEGDVDPTRSYWDFGDGTDRVPLVPSSSGNFVPNCATAVPLSSAVNCTATPATTTPTHAYYRTGTFTARLVVTDTEGLTSLSSVTIVVDSEFLYVSEQHGQDDTYKDATGNYVDAVYDPEDPNPYCGPISPYFHPCKTIDEALKNAVAHNKTDILVAGYGSGSTRSYPAFTVRPTINVYGGRDDSGGVDAEWTYDPALVSRVVGVQDTGPDTRYSVMAKAGHSPTLLSSLTLEPGNPTPGASTPVATDVPVQGIIVDNFTGLTLDKVTIKNGSGRNPSAVLLTNGSVVQIKNSDITSGSAVKPDSRLDTANRSTYGIRAIGGSKVSVENTKITTGSGAKGADGSAGTDRTDPACTGRNSVNYSGSTNSGCTDAKTGNVSGYGGAGGAGGGFFSAGKSGGLGGTGAGSPSNGGSGGSGGYCITPRPKAGQGGRGGSGGGPNNAARGDAGSKSYTASGATWVGLQAGAGKLGSPGGGGGGAGGGGGTYCAGAATGPSGAAGGGGGLGGPPGASGGWAGGGSFGIYSTGGVPNPVTVDATSRIQVGPGGKGGTGGAGGRGGDGGSGGTGTIQTKGANGSGGGGGGGGGGASGGGGGAGGPSVGVFVLGSNGPAVSAGATIVTSGSPTGDGGPGGPGGNGGPGGGAQSGTGDQGHPGTSGAAGRQGAPGHDGQTGYNCTVFAPVATGNDNCFKSTVQWIKRIGPERTGLSNPSWEVKFDRPVTGLNSSHFELTKEGVSASNTLSVSGANDTWTVTAAGVSGQGRLGILLKNVTGITSNGTQIDNPAPTPFRGEYYLIDTEAPTVLAITRAGISPTNSNIVTWYVTFSEPVTAVFASNFSTTGGLGGTVQPPQAVGEAPTQTWTVGYLLSSASIDGTVGLNLSTNHNLIKDEAGNQLAPGTTVGETYTIDRKPPEIESVKRKVGVRDPSNLSTVIFEIRFSEPIYGELRPEQLELVYTGSLTGGTIPDRDHGGIDTPGSGNIEDPDARIVWWVTVNNLTGNGTVGIRAKNPSTISDDATNVLNATAQSPSPNQVFTIDLIPPSGGGFSYNNNVINPYNTPSRIIDIALPHPGPGPYGGLADNPGGSGLDNDTTLERRSATLVNGSDCLDDWTPWVVHKTLNVNNENYLEQFADGTEACFQYRYTVRDRAGNETLYTSDNKVRVDFGAPDNVSIDYLTGEYRYSPPFLPSVRLNLTGGVDPASCANGVCGSKVERFIGEYADKTCNNWSSQGRLAFYGSTLVDDGSLSWGPLIDRRCYKYEFIVSDANYNEAIANNNGGYLRIASSTWASHVFNFVTAPAHLEVYSTNSDGVAYGGETPWPDAISGTSSTDASSITSVTATMRRLKDNTYCNSGGCGSASPLNLAGTVGSGQNPTWTVNYPKAYFPSGGSYETAVTVTDNVGNKSTYFRRFFVDYDPQQTVFVSATTGNDLNNGFCPVSSGDSTCEGPGTMGPKKSLNAGIYAASKANPPRMVVVVAAGTYPQVNVGYNSFQTAVRGGYSPSSWLRAKPGTNVSKVVGAGVGVEALSSRLTFQQMEIESGTPKGAGGSGEAVAILGGQPTPAYNWNTDSPMGGVNDDYFSARFTTEFTTPPAGIAGFQVQEETGDGGRIWLRKLTGGAGPRMLIQENWADEATAVPRNSIPINLEGNTLYRLEFEMYEATGTASAYLRPVVPATPVWQANSWLVEYFNDYGASAYGIRTDDSLVGGGKIELDRTKVTAAPGMSGRAGKDGANGIDASASTLGGTPMVAGCNAQSARDVAPCHSGTIGHQNGGVNANPGNSGNPWMGAPNGFEGLVLDEYTNDSAGNPPGGPFGEFSGSRSIQVGGYVISDTSTVNNRSRRWSGWLNPPESGTYTFRVSSSDGQRLVVNGQTLVNNWVQRACDYPAGAKTATIVLSAGQLVPFVYEQYHGTAGGECAAVEWSRPTNAGNFEFIPASQFIQPAIGGPGGRGGRTSMNAGANGGSGVGGLFGGAGGAGGTWPGGADGANKAGGGAGGAGGTAGPSGTAGESGLNAGQDNQTGTQFVLPGHASGLAGSRGNYGGGGGGGGGGGASQNDAGSGGGGGGGGGSAGLAGTAGTAGGGSFGIWASGTVTVDVKTTATVTAGNGGAGGRGGNGGKGGNATAGGAGGECWSSNSYLAAGGGGGGGAGGTGAGGSGGGAGGPSYGVYKAGSVTYILNGTINSGSGGAGGAKGTGGAGGTKGAGGAAGKGVAGCNAGTAGADGTQGDAGGTPAANGQTGLSGQKNFS